MRVVALQSNYMPWKGYFDLIHDADVFCFYDEVQYTKNDWRNRNRIYSKNGLQWLTIPIAASAVKLKISEVALPEGWQELHWKTLRLAYGRAPHFAQLESLMQELYGHSTATMLSAFNRHTIQKIAAYLGLRTRFENSADYMLEPGRVERLVSLLRQIGATEYLSGPSASAYLAGAEDKFAQHGIAIQFKSYGPYLPYRQLREPFQDSVSILDLVANVERRALGRHIWGAG